MDGNHFDWPLTYLKRRASLKLGKVGESKWIQMIFGSGKNNQVFQVQHDDGKWYDVIPDVLTGSVVGDAKDTKSLSFTQQLQDFFAIAKPTRVAHRNRVRNQDGSSLNKTLNFEIIVRHKSHSEGETKVYGPLKQAADQIHYKITDKDVKLK